MARAALSGGRVERRADLWTLPRESPPSGEHQLAVTRLIRPFEDSISAAGRTDLYAVIGVGVKISSTLRTGLIPDVVVMDRIPAGASFPAEALVLAVEVWSPGTPGTNARRGWSPTPPPACRSSGPSAARGTTPGWS
ncbi:Uma2 family endonuclease [Actinosynnema sp. NPDC023794]